MDLEDAVKKPWLTSYHRPPRYKTFWNSKLDGMAKQRHLLWRRWKRTQTEEDLQALRALQKAIKREVRCSKRSSYKKFLYRLSILPRGQAVSNLSKMSKCMKARLYAHQTNGVSLPPLSFSTHVASKCSGQEQWSPPPPTPSK